MGSRVVPTKSICRSTRVIGQSNPNQSLLQNLIGEDLLIEILSRIPTPLLAFRCKLVCKRWCSLISSPYFISRFKHEHIKHESCYPKPLLGMLANTVGMVSMTDFENDPDDNEFNFRGFNLDYLPEQKGISNIIVVASCNDLILCEAESGENNKSGKSHYYLCNPFTMQWVALPPPPPPQSQWNRCMTRTGLVCEPYNCRGRGIQGQRGPIDDYFDQCRYRIVRFYYEYNICDLQKGYPVETYCSETSKWIRCDDLGEEYWFESKTAAYNGKLHWVNRNGKYLVTYDPFDMGQTSLPIDPSSDDFWSTDYYHVGECEGVLRVMRLGRRRWWHGDQNETMIFKDLSVWELQEEEDQHDQDTMIITRLILKDFVVFSEAINNSDLNGIKELGFHPRNKDVLFLVINDFITSLNTQTRELKVETQFKYSPRYQYAFTLQLPWWPTPILNPSPTS